MRSSHNIERWESYCGEAFPYKRYVDEQSLDVKTRFFSVIPCNNQHGRSEFQLCDVFIKIFKFSSERFLYVHVRLLISVLAMCQI